MKKKFIALCILSVLILNAFIIVPASAATTNPYGTTRVGCISNISMNSHTMLQNDVQYFSANVTSYQRGTTSTALTYTTYGAIGGENTKMFVYSIGNNSNTDFQTKTVKAIMQQFANDNPDWIPVAAINGDFFDIETSNTPGMGEPENVMIQNGDILKGHHLQGTAGCGVIGIKPDGTPIFHINGFSGTTEFSRTNGRYHLTIMNSNKTTTLGEHKKIGSDRAPNESTPSIITPDSPAAVDLTGMDVYVVNCDTYRYAYRGGTGHVDSQGDYTYFASGLVASKRAGTTNEKPASGKVYIAISPNLSTTLAVGTYVKVNQVVNANWQDVENAVGFKQAILVNGNSEFVKGLSSTSSPNSQVADMSYADCWKHRSAIGFRPDGTPVILAIKKATDNKGASYYEIAEQLKALGCTYGFVLDGGGSTTMIIRNNNGTYTNAFIGEGTNGRSIGNAIILAVPKNSSTPTPPDNDQNTEDKTEEPTTEEPTTEEPTTEEPTEPSENTFVPVANGNEYIAHAITSYTVNGESKGVDIDAFELDYADSIGLKGWAGFGQSIKNLGYFFDNDRENIHWNSNFVAEADENMKEQGGSKTRAFNFDVNINLVSAGSHTVSFILKLNDGTFVIVDTLSFTSKQSAEENTTEDVTEQPTEEPTTAIPDGESSKDEIHTNQGNKAPGSNSNSCGSAIGGISAIMVAIATTCAIYTKKKRK